MLQSLDELRTSGTAAILFECVYGSRAYGTSTGVSDEDIRGVFAVPSTAYLALTQPVPQLSDTRGDTVYFSLRRFTELLAAANPNMLELLFMPDDCVRRTSPEFERLLASRRLFVTRHCADTHVGYAMSQIKKARGQNKWVNNPKPAVPPSKEDFCFIVPSATLLDPGQLPARPVPLAKLGWTLGEYHVARLEHARDMFRCDHSRA